MGRYSQLVTVNIEHQYFQLARDLGPAFQFVPTQETASLIRRSDLILRTTSRSLHVFFDETRLEALRSETNQQDEPATLAFKVFASDPNFKNYTAPAVLMSNATLFFESAEGVETPKDTSVSLHAGDFATSAVYSTYEDLSRFPGVLENRDLIVKPDFIFRIKLGKKDFASITPPPGRTYGIRFQARETIWKYYVLGNFKKDIPSITDVRNQTEFEFTGKASLPGEKTALTYRSKTPIPLREQHDVRFQLRERNVSSSKVLIRRLPVASAHQFGKEVIDGRETIVSEIFINC